MLKATRGVQVLSSGDLHEMRFSRLRELRATLSPGLHVR